ncbi:GNAT family N-acetyltransferase [Sphingobacterium sp. LRF_L2]|uniref:GNAT family N-acetyltransferase n=1 Tax=Sphingobacterium sp. LRF_L2 TaxID=3369421 RepID=UPI003F5F9C97
MKIISKFVVGSDQGIDFFLSLREAEWNEFYPYLQTTDNVEGLKNKFLNRNDTIDELNALGTQMVIAFSDDLPVGYVLFKNSVDKQGIFKEQKSVQLLSFYILPTYDVQEIGTVLWNKCFASTRSYHHWIMVLENSLLIPFLENYGFQILAKSQHKIYSVSSYLMARVNDLV